MYQFLVRVYFEDTDAGGIVYYANYLRFMERARTEWLRSLGYEQDRLLEQSIGFVVKQVEMDYHAPAKFNDLLSIHTQLVKLNKASMLIAHSVKNENEQTLVTAKIRIACVNMSKMKPMPIPSDLLGELSSAF